MTDRRIDSARGRACVLRGNDIDTDRIIPARYLMCVTFDGLGEFAFEDDRKQAKGDHALDDDRFEGASILVVEANFGCGSSREHAPQALMRRGFKAFIGVSFGEIFSGNCTANGLICARLSAADIATLMESIELDPSQEVAIDVEAKTVTAKSGVFRAEIPEGARNQLLEGTWQATGVLLDAATAIDATAKGLPYTTGFAGS
ncbi:MAG: 3-isopropylmalate dehydratase small subunit [Myxococcales bacterium]|nr:3-isopropylmalate dehydratase small subunit [Myxococcales bacterium]